MNKTREEDYFIHFPAIFIWTSLHVETDLLSGQSARPASSSPVNANSIRPDAQAENWQEVLFTFKVDLEIN